MRLGDLLVANNLITPEQLQQALVHQEKTGQKLGEGLITLGVLTEDGLQSFLAQQRKKLRIGDQLVAEGLITQDQLMTALGEQKKSGRKLGQTIVQLGILSEKDFLTFLSEQLDLPYVDLKNFQLRPDVVQILPEGSARRFRAIVLAQNAEGLMVGMADPTDVFVFDELTRLLKSPPRIALVSEADLLQVLDRVYRRTEQMKQHVEALEEEVSRNKFDLNEIIQSEMAVDAPVVRILQSIFEDAVKTRASDIHIEPDEHVMRIRLRVDGVLQEQIVKEKHIAPALVSKLKLLAGLEIAEKRLPQDGRFNIKVMDKSIDVRISTLPIQNGESVVMRLLDQSGGNLRLAQVGIDPEILARFRSHITRPHGLVLVTGPTGSGKTTTLYGALNELNEPGKKIITVEDPVEYRLERINQVQVRTKIGLTFALALRTMLRQDPDVILVGEMRDQETSEIAVRAALTGHLVLSTLHTNDAVSTCIRLVEMGVDGFAVSSALRCILAQRLARRICRSCVEVYQPIDDELIFLRGMIGPVAEKVKLSRGRGCHNCNNTGYMGRIAVAELLEMNKDLADALRRNDAAEFVNRAMKLPGYRPLNLACLTMAGKGITTLSEVMRLSADVEQTGPQALAQARAKSA
ncbi:MAG: Flp pilus assembly complex ATPase component TadA [Magnetococcales bacterium]|nr:Flp pilus assembly complex ATPase component TadA [Magnetococcales bacterium]